MKYFFHITFVLLALLCAACAEDDALSTDGRNAVPLAGIQTEIEGGMTSRAPALDKERYVGRSAFKNKDQMVLTSVQRTDLPIPSFSYKGVVYDYEVGQGQTSGGWNRDDSKGETKETPPRLPSRIYWSDAQNPHTFIGYSVPQQPTEQVFDWNMRLCYETGAAGNQVGVDVYYGSLGNPLEADTPIDHTDSINIVHDDLLLTYDDQKLAETGGSVARLYFKHGLAMARVIVNISGFTASSESADARTIVSDMTLKNMFTMYKWRQGSAGVQTLTEGTDQEKLDDIYGADAVRYDQRKDTKAWIPYPDGKGTGIGKQFVFYALAVPAQLEADVLKMQFTVHYQDPMEPWIDPATQLQPNMKQHVYTAVMPQSVEFRAGHCTTIHISLNHSNEEITMGAEYMDWQYIETPDQSELKKKKNMLTADMLERTNFTILGDPKANEDDATWLYLNKTTQKIQDIYGNDGSREHPFLISTAQELVSFAHEVKGDGRQSVTYTDLDGISHTLSSGQPVFDFTNYYVKLDANVVLQPNLTTETFVEWCGVGYPRETHPNSYFNGFFLGNGSSITRLFGSPFFFHLGSNAVVEHLIFSDVIEVDGRGIVANESNGLLCAVYVDGTIRQKEPENAADKECYSGGLIGTVESNGGLIGCASIGEVKAWAIGDGAIGGLVGYNKGVLVSCFRSGLERNLEKTVGQGYHTYAGLGKYDPVNSIAFSCYFDKSVDPDKTDYAILTPGRLCYPATTELMQSADFVNSEDELPVGDISHGKWFTFHYSLNKGITEFMTHVLDGTLPATATNASHRAWMVAHSDDYQFTYYPGAYPRIN